MEEIDHTWRVLALPPRMHRVLLTILKSGLSDTHARADSVFADDREDLRKLISIATTCREVRGTITIEGPVE